MRRSVALLVLCATSWSYVAALGCEMGRSAAGAPSAHHGPTPRADGHHHGAVGHGEAHPGAATAPNAAAASAAAGGDEPTPRHAPAGDVGGERCLAMMLCGVVTSPPTPAPTVHQQTASTTRLVPASSSIPGAASPSLDPPPPRSSV